MTLIGKGSYGKIYDKVSHIEKHIGVYECGTMSEMYFFTHYWEKKDFLTDFYGIEIDKKSETIIFKLSNAGKSLTYCITTMIPIKRYALLPSFLFQFGSILSFLKNKKIIHCDINPNNICFNESTGNITLIDFGFAIPCDGAKRMHTGTRSFTNQHYYNKICVHDYNYDVYASGMTLFSWINGYYIVYYGDTLEKSKSNVLYADVLDFNLILNYLSYDILKELINSNDLLIMANMIKYNSHVDSNDIFAYQGLDAIDYYDNPDDINFDRVRHYVIEDSTICSTCSTCSCYSSSSSSSKEDIGSEESIRLKAQKNKLSNETIEKKIYECFRNNDSIDIDIDIDIDYLIEFLNASKDVSQAVSQDIPKNY